MNLLLFSSRHEMCQQLKTSSGIHLKWERTSRGVRPWPAHADRGRLPSTNKERKNPKRLCRAWRRQLVAQRRFQHAILQRARSQFANRCWILPRKWQKTSSLRLFCSAGRKRFIIKSFLLWTLSRNTPSELIILINISFYFWLVCINVKQWIK